MIHEALAAIAADVPAVTKDHQNQQQGFKYRGIDDVYAAVHPLFTKHGVFSVPTVLEERSEERQTKSGGALIYRIVKVKYDFYAKDGSTLCATVMGEGMDSGDKASNKALAVAHKYALVQILSIPTEEAFDPEQDSPEPAPKARPATAAAPRPPVAAADPRIDLIKGALDTLCPTDVERQALKAELWEQYDKDIGKILEDLELRVLKATHVSGRKSA
jgi:hypothetical protein